MTPCTTASQSRNRRNSILRAQFSLRSLFVLVSLVAMGMGGWSRLVEPYRFQRAAAQTISAEGGSCELAGTLPRWLRRLGLPGLDQHFQEIVATDLPPETTVSCRNLLPRLRSLERLMVSGSDFRDVHLHALSGHKRLRQVKLRGTMVTDETVAAFQSKVPGLTLEREALAISFDDLRFAMPPNGVFDRSLLTPRIEAINGSNVRIEGMVMTYIMADGRREFWLLGRIPSN